jgi:hypothetical protein
MNSGAKLYDLAEKKVKTSVLQKLFEICQM